MRIIVNLCSLDSNKISSFSKLKKITRDPANFFLIIIIIIIIIIIGVFFRSIKNVRGEGCENFIACTHEHYSCHTRTTQLGSRTPHKISRTTQERFTAK